MDVGYKRLLRCARKSLRQWFDEWCPVNESMRYKWNKKPDKNEKWYRAAEEFLMEEVAAKEGIKKEKNNSFIEKQIWITAFLLQPTLGKPIYAGAKK